MASIPKAERLLNLVICLMSARQFVSAEFLRKNVAGYADSGQGEDTFKRMLERDKNELRELGIPVETGRNPMAVEEGYRISRDDYALGDITLDPDEAAAVAAAAAVWQEPEVGVVSQTAVLKLRAAGVEVLSPDELGVMSTGAARSIGSESVIASLVSAVEAAQAVTFTHRTAAGRTTRRLEPWGIRGSHGRWYVVGHDLDRAATRTFRLSRIADVATASDPGTVQVPADADLSAIVEAAVSQTAGATGTARVWLAADRGHTLRRMARSTLPAEFAGEPGDEIEIDVQSRSGLIRAVLAAGADAVVLGPDDLRTQVIAEIDRLVESGGNA